MTEPTLEQDFQAVLTGEHPGLTGRRNRLRRIPAFPRCKLCMAPFGGPGGLILRHLGFARFEGNPQLCNNCIVQFQRLGVRGAEIPLTALFADIRGSTGIGERLRPHEFSAYLQRFYDLAVSAVVSNDGLADKLVGDEVVALFFGGVTGPAHAAAAIAAGRELLRRAGRDDASDMGPIPVGVGIHTGEAYVGTVGTEGAVTDFTALGDAVNTTARLVAQAAAGELTASVAAATAAGLDVTDLERRTVEIRGRTEPLEIVVLGAAA
jgi:adenylate cyclase